MFIKNKFYSPLVMANAPLYTHNYGRKKSKNFDLSIFKGKLPKVPEKYTNNFSEIKYTIKPKVSILVRNKEFKIGSKAKIHSDGTMATIKNIGPKQIITFNNKKENRMSVNDFVRLN
jgi:hypothetical protein